jgi:hypothetical protein
MSKDIKGRIERLLEEQPNAPDRIGSRLAATFAEGLREPAGPRAGRDESALMAAFLDGHLSETEAADFRVSMAADPALRADLEAMEALVDSLSADRSDMPKDLLTRAQAAFAPATAARERTEQAAGWSWLAALWPGRVGAAALAAALIAVAVIGPAMLLTGGRVGSPDIGQEQPTASPTPPALDVTTPQRPECDSPGDQKSKPETATKPADATADGKARPADATTDREKAKPAGDTQNCPPSPADNSQPK